MYVCLVHIICEVSDDKAEDSLKSTNLRDNLKYIDISARQCIGFIIVGFAHVLPIIA